MTEVPSTDHHDLEPFPVNATKFAPKRDCLAAAGKRYLRATNECYPQTLPPMASFAVRRVESSY